MDDNATQSVNPTPVQQNTVSSPASPGIKVPDVQAVTQGPTVSPAAINSTPSPVVPTESITTHAADKVSGGRIQTPIQEPVKVDPPTQPPVSDAQPLQNSQIAPPAEETASITHSTSEIPVEPQAASQAAQPVVSVPAGKELEPHAAPLPDVAKMTEEEIVQEEKAVETELEKLVEQSPMDKKMDLPKEIKNIGAALANEDNPMPDFSSGAGALPMTYEEALKTKKKSRIKESIKWLSTLIIYHWKKMRAKPEDTGGSAFG